MPLPPVRRSASLVTSTCHRALPYHGRTRKSSPAPSAAQAARLDKALAEATGLSRERVKALIGEGRGRIGGADRRRRFGEGRRRHAISHRRPRRCRAEAQPQDIPLDSRLRRRAPDRGRQARRAGRPPGGGQSRRHAGQRAAAPLRRAACRASAASRGPASSTGSTRIPPACWSSPRPTRRMKGWPRSSPTIRSSAPISPCAPAIRSACRARFDGRLGRSRRQPQEDGRLPDNSAAGKHAVTHYKVLQRLDRCALDRMPAGNRAHPPGARSLCVNRPCAIGRSALWTQRPSHFGRMLDTLGFPPSGAARRGTWLRSPDYRRKPSASSSQSAGRYAGELIDETGALKSMKCAARPGFSSISNRVAAFARMPIRGLSERGRH